MRRVNRTRWILLVIIVIAAGLRLWRLDAAPPGLNQDEACNSWNAWCLWQTGRDAAGESWPLTYTRGLGANRSTLAIYTMIPFVATGGLNVWTTRLPNALAGIATVALAFYLGRRWFGPRIGLCCAALLAVNPWHLQLTRWGHEAGLVPFLVVTTLALATKAGWIARSNAQTQQSIWWSIATGVFAGIACYGYPALRIFLPAILILGAIITATSRDNDNPRVKRSHLVLALAAFFIVIAPVVYQHLQHADQIAKRAVTMETPKNELSFVERVQLFANRYPQHFGTEFLFRYGDHFAPQKPAGAGAFHWYTLPLLIAGVIALVPRIRTDRAVQWLALWILLYPIASALYDNYGVHSLRAAPGLVALILLVAVGLDYLLTLLASRPHGERHTALVIFLAVFVTTNVQHLNRLFGIWYKSDALVTAYHADLIEALQWITNNENDEREESHDIPIYITTRRTSLPYIVALVALQYDPAAWHAGPREILTDRYWQDPSQPGPWDVCTRFSRFHFMYEKIESAPKEPAAVDAWWIVRPNEFRELGPPAHIIGNAENRPLLHIHRTTPPRESRDLQPTPHLAKMRGW